MQANHTPPPTPHELSRAISELDTSAARYRERADVDAWAAERDASLERTARWLELVLLPLLEQPELLAEALARAAVLGRLRGPRRRYTMAGVAERLRAGSGLGGIVADMLEGREPERAKRAFGGLCIDCGKLRAPHHVRCAECIAKGGEPATAKDIEAIKRGAALVWGGELGKDRCEWCFVPSSSPLPEWHHEDGSRVRVCAHCMSDCDIAHQYVRAGSVDERATRPVKLEPMALTIRNDSDEPRVYTGGVVGFSPDDQHAPFGAHGASSFDADELDDGWDDDACELCHTVHCTDADDEHCAELEHARREVKRGGDGDL